MTFFQYYSSPIGRILLMSDESALKGLWFDNEKISSQMEEALKTNESTPVLDITKRWLDIYFSGREPDFTPKLNPDGTAFRLAVWKKLLQIPYGQTTTYGEIARQIAAERKIPRMSSQAVGGAVGNNDISIIIPCHRVIGANGNLTGYGGGIDRKIMLLKTEHIDTANLFIPRQNNKS